VQNKYAIMLLTIGIVLTIVTVSPLALAQINTVDSGNPCPAGQVPTVNASGIIQFDPNNNPICHAAS
jgi:hypothetical protein